MKRLVHLFLSLVLIANGHTAHAIPVIWFQGDGQQSQVVNNGQTVPITTGGLHNEHGDQIANHLLPAQAIIIHENGHAYYAQLPLAHDGIQYYEIGEEVRFSKDGKTVSGEYIVSQNTAVDNASEKTVPGNKVVKGNGNGEGAGSGKGNGSGAGAHGQVQAQGAGSVLVGGLALAGSSLMKGLYTTGEQMLMGIVLTGESAKNTAKLQQEIAQITQYNAQINNLNLQIQNQMIVDAYRNNQMLSQKNIDLLTEEYNFKTSDTKALNALKLNRTVLNSAFSFDPKQRFAKQKGLELNTQADDAYSTGDTEAGDGYLKYARAFADIAVGLDPITGPIRDTYEALTGQNLITGEELNDTERAFAIIGAVTFGFGSKIHRGFDLIRKTKLHQAFLKNFDKALEIGKKVAVGSSKILTRWDYAKAFKSAPLLMTKLLAEEPGTLNRYVGLINETNAITFKGNAKTVKQTFTKEALDMFEKVKAGEQKVFYRMGDSTKNKILSATTEMPQYWAINKEHLYRSFDEYSDLMGSYANKYDFIQVAERKGPGAFVIRNAPGGLIEQAGKSPIKTKGGGLEIVFENSGFRPLESVSFKKLDGLDLSTAEKRKVVVDEIWESLNK